MPMGEKLVSVVIATYNGERYLRAQLDSILDQTYRNLEIVVCDDRSKDGTADILQEYAQGAGIKWHRNEERLGPAQNFGRAISLARGDYVAFSDQDDVWKPTKIETSVSAMVELENSGDPDVPILVFTDLTLVDEQLRTIADSYYGHMGRNPRLNTLNRILAGNIVAGCGALANRKLIDLAMPIPREAIMHDSWLALVASTLGKLRYVDVPTVLYRQHANNTVGGVRTLLHQKAGRALSLRFDNAHYRQALIVPRYPQARALLDRHRERITPDKRALMLEFLACERKGFVSKRISILMNGFLRHSRTENIELLIRI